MPLYLRLVCLAALMTGPAIGQEAEEVEFAKEFFVDVQIQSLIENREYCGYFGRDIDGSIVATKPHRGKYNGCDMPIPPSAWKIFASYHTHAATDPESYNELPSLQDLLSDVDAGINGYVVTPGGRLWFSDHMAEEVRQICSPGCLPQDPSYRRGKFEKIRSVYSREQLEWLMGP